MPFYNVKVWDGAYYPAIRAESPEEAERIAEQWFYERQPSTVVEEFKPACDACYHNYNEDSADSVSACNCCKNFDFFEPNN